MEWYNEDERTDYEGHARGVTSLAKWVGCGFLAVVLLLVLIGRAHANSNWYVDTLTPLGGSATFTGATRDTGAAAPVYTTFGCGFNADQAGNAFVDDSVDGTNWFVAATVAVAIGVRGDLNVPLRARYNRCRYVNGATIQGSFRVVSSFRN